MAKRKKVNPKKESNKLVYILWILLFIAAALGSFVAGYYFGYDDADTKALKKEKIKEKKKVSIIEKKQDIPKQNELNDRLKDVLKKESLPLPAPKIPEPVIIEKPKTLTQPVSEYHDASHEYEGDVLPLPPIREKVKTISKPKLAIIIDDVSVKSQVDAIKGLNLPITMSFLPPSKYRPNSHVLASRENFYMVHLPMEAQKFTREEPHTLKVSDSQDLISKRVAEVKKLFPKVKYINNHTGSKFTSNEDAVNRLVNVLEQEHIYFIDSRTIASTKVPNVMKNHGSKYVARDVFLDHKYDKEYIKAQILKSIEVAKAHGSAIAIGHPHENTIMAIHESKNLLKEVELVLVDKLY